jgi:hypothetical protein
MLWRREIRWIVNVLNHPGVRCLLLQAWQDSRPATDEAHEEGGFILRNADGSLAVVRWPRGLRNQIVVPPHPGGVSEGRVIVATFHTHPNTGPDYQQEPSLTDRRAVSEDPDLRHPEYEGEYVISVATVYRVHLDGSVEVVGGSREVLGVS